MSSDQPPPFYQRKKKKSRTTNPPFFSSSSSNNNPLLPPTKTSLSFYTNALFRCPSSSTTMPLPSGINPRTWKDRDSSDEEEEPFAIDATHREGFAWSHVILPFLFPALGGLLFGFDIGATSSAAISLQSPKLSGTTWFNLSAIQLGFVVSGSLYGAVLGSLLIYPIADYIGRKLELILASLLYVLSGLTTACAPGLGFLLFGRLLYGLGIGVAMHAAPLYIAETCPSQIRGTLISLKELFIVLGMLMGYSVGSFWISSVGGWRYMFGFSAPIALIMGLGMWSLPQSPRWLLLRAVQGNKGSRQEYQEKAIFALCKLRGRPPGDKIYEKEIEDTLASLKSVYTDKESEGSFMEVLQGPSFKAVIIGGAKVSVYIGVCKLLMTGVAVLKVDDLGRKPLLIGGVSGIAVSLFLLSAYYKFLQGFPFVAVASLLLCVSSYQISFGPISWLMVSEIFPIRTRGRGISLAVITNFGSHAIITFAFSPMQELLGATNLFFLFGLLTLVSLAFIVFIVPETKGLSLEEIESKILGVKADREEISLV
ncbi:hypothetical protein LguiA_020923 [Lonicera macranthoides]